MKIFIVLVVAIASLGFITGNDTDVTVVSGVVVNEKTGKPVKGSLVYVVEGEEEALTKEKGEFRITTAKKTPLTVTAEHQQYLPATVTVTDVNQTVIIRLKAK